MKTYLSQAIYRIICEGVLTEQYEEQWRLLYAQDDRDALNGAREVAREEECSFVDRHGRRIAWQFVAVKDLNEVRLNHGTLLFSQIREVEPVSGPLMVQSA